MLGNGSPRKKWHKKREKDIRRISEMERIQYARVELAKLTSRTVAILSSCQLRTHSPQETMATQWERAECNDRISQSKHLPEECAARHEAFRTHPESHWEIFFFFLRLFVCSSVDRRFVRSAKHKRNCCRRDETIAKYKNKINVNLVSIVSSTIR